MKLLGMAFLLIGVAGFAGAGTPNPAPEINAGTAGSALALLVGGLLVLRGRRKK